jgi:hypothetical protein
MQSSRQAGSCQGLERAPPARISLMGSNRAHFETRASRDGGFMGLVRHFGWWGTYRGLQSGIE